MSDDPVPLRRPRGRYAPSPTGELHLGNASTALWAWLSIRARGGSFVMRIEDLDPGRSRPHFAEQLLEDLRWFGIDWDEGPDVGGPFMPYDQSSRQAAYAEAFGRLRDAGQVYPCFCSRKDIAAAAGAPQEPGESRRYAGTCRRLAEGEAAARIGAGVPHAWRFRVDAAAAPPTFDDQVHGRFAARRVPGDFVVWRRDGAAAYQLAVVVDDAWMGIDEVVRGDDLLESTFDQLLLCAALEITPPRYGHVPLLMGADGARLSKRHAGITLRELREAGWKASALIGRLAAWMGLGDQVPKQPAVELIRNFELRRLPRIPDGIVVDLPTLDR